MSKYKPNKDRYDLMEYRRCGSSGVLLPEISLGLWHNFGDVDAPEVYKETLHFAFDAGITHFDLANNYGPPPGSAEENFGKILKKSFKAHRDELIISTKAGYRMWDGPYGEWGSKKYLVASLDQSLKRMHLDYVDIFYSHRYDPETPLEETMEALDLIVRQGKALYAGISNYGPQQTSEALQILQKKGTPYIIHQPRYNLLDREPETGLLEILEKEKIGCIPYSPLAQGILSNKYLKGVPENSRAGSPHGFLQTSQLTTEVMAKVQELHHMAENRGQTLAQMAVAWLLSKPVITSVLVGAKNKQQLKDILLSRENIVFSKDELKQIDKITKRRTPKK